MHRRPPLCVLVPSRGRPENVKRLTDLWRDTVPCAEIHFLFDGDDETLDRCVEAIVGDAGAPPQNVALSIGPRTEGIAPLLNHHAAWQARQWPYLGFMGDDHLPRTENWADIITDRLAAFPGGNGFVYANDLNQGPRLPTSVFVSSSAVLALGYLCPRGLRHLYLDNAWLAWGLRWGRLAYLGDVVIEHLHPTIGKSEWDDSYRANNSEDRYDADKAMFDAYITSDLDADVLKLRALA